MLSYTYDKDFIDYNYPTLINLLPKITNKYSIKSGTTDTDMWIIGYNKNAVLGVWAGYDDNRSFNQNYSSYHRDVWINTMEAYLKDKKNDWYTAPNNIIGVPVNPITGELSKEGDKKSKIFYFVKGTEPHTDTNYDLDLVFKKEEMIEEENNSTDNEN